MSRWWPHSVSIRCWPHLDPTRSQLALSAPFGHFMTRFITFQSNSFPFSNQNSKWEEIKNNHTKKKANSTTQ